MNPYALLRQTLKRPLFIPFAVLGDPDAESSLEMLQTLTESGADALELGFPFSDPTADGPVIQAADKRALSAGATTEHCFRIIERLRAQHSVPIGLLVYFNLVLQYGIQAFYLRCRELNVQSVLIADLPLEHADEILAAARAQEIAPVFLVSELTTEERLQKILAIAEGYLYVTSYLGVTGKVQEEESYALKRLLDLCKRQTDLPLFVGFGISTAGDVRSALAAGADGVIVGSRIVREVPDLDRVRKVCMELRKGMEG